MKWSCKQQRLLRRLGCEHIWTPLRAKQTQYYYGFSLCSCLLMVSTGRWCSEWLLLQLVQSPLFCLLNCYMMQIFLEKSGFSFNFFFSSSAYTEPSQIFLVPCFYVVNLPGYYCRCRLSGVVFLHQPSCKKLSANMSLPINKKFTLQHKKQISFQASHVSRCSENNKHF